MRILYFTRDYTPHDHRFLAALAETEHEVLYLRLERGKRQVEDRPVPPHISEVQWEGGKSHFRWRHVPFLLSSLKQVLSVVKPDLIHAGPVQQPAFLAALSGFHPLLTMSWGFDLLKDMDRNIWWRWITKFTLERTDVLACDCYTVQQKAEENGFPPQRAIMFPWGVDLDRFSPGEGADFRSRMGWQDAFILLSNRSWEPNYGVDIVARAFAQAAMINPQIRLLLLGGGSQDILIKGILSAHGLLDRVHFAGQVSNNDQTIFYRAADLFVSASHVDGSSVSLMEALACGIPVLVSDIPSNLEWVKEGEQGFVFKDGDSTALKNRIIEASSHPDRLRTMGLKARATAEDRADWRKNFNVLLQGYQLAYSTKNTPKTVRAVPKGKEIVAIIQARMGSSRLPGKVLMDIAGKPMLVHVVERARRSKLINRVVVATTTDIQDDAIEKCCQVRGFDCYRGSVHDVLDRFYKAAVKYHSDVVVRFTADCPLLDPEVVDHTISEFLRAGVDFAANRLPPPLKRTYPIGLDTEVCTFQALERAWKEAKEPHEREHVMPFMYDVSGRFNILQVDYVKDYGDIRWTVDTAEDLELVRRIFSHFSNRDNFSWLEVLSLFERDPDLALANASVRHKTYMDVDERAH